MSRRPHRSPYASVLRLRNFRRLSASAGVSSLGDWIALLSLVSATNRISGGNGVAIAGLMGLRLLPAIVVAPIVAAGLRRWDRKRAMSLCDASRAVVVVVATFGATLPVLYVAAFLLECAALVWMTARDELVPQIVPNRWLDAAGSIALFAAYGVLPLGALAFTGLAAIGRTAGVGAEGLALVVAAACFLSTAVLVRRIDHPGLQPQQSRIRLRAVGDDLREAARHLRAAGSVTRVVGGTGVAVAGGAVVFSLGAPWVSRVLHGGAAGFGALVACSGAGVGAGVVALGALGDRLGKGTVFALSTIAAGCALTGVSLVRSLPLALFGALCIGTFGGMAYATGFALVQDLAPPPTLGTTMASLQLVIRMSLLVSIVVFPLVASFAGVALAIAAGGLVTTAAGTLAARDVLTGRIG